VQPGFVAILLPRPGRGILGVISQPGLYKGMEKPESSSFRFPKHVCDLCKLSPPPNPGPEMGAWKETIFKMNIH
jgi:hypothetical protein